MVFPRDLYLALFYFLYMSTTSQHISGCLVIQYADDTQFLHTGSIGNIDDLVRRGEETLTEAKKYFQINGLMLNSGKTRCMCIGSRGLTSQIPGDTCIRFDDCSIVPACSVMNLGIYFYTHMTFDTHVTYISRKVFGTIAYINRIKDNFNRKAGITLIQSLVLSIMNYGLKIWGTANTTHMNRVQKLQNLAAKVALGGGARRDHATPYLKELGWLKLRQKYKYDLGFLFIIQLKETVPGMYCHCLRCGMWGLSPSDNSFNSMFLGPTLVLELNTFLLKGQICGTVSLQRSNVHLLRKVCANI